MGLSYTNALFVVSELCSSLLNVRETEDCRDRVLPIVADSIDVFAAEKIDVVFGSRCLGR